MGGVFVSDNCDFLSHARSHAHAHTRTDGHMRRFTEVGAPIEERIAASAAARVAELTLALLRVRRDVDEVLSDKDALRPWGDAALRALAPGTVTFVALVVALALRTLLVVLVRVRTVRILREARRAIGGLH